MYPLPCMARVVCPWILASLQCRDEARRDFTDQADIAGTKREASRGVRRVARRVRCSIYEPRVRRTWTSCACSLDMDDGVERVDGAQMS